MFGVQIDFKDGSKDWVDPVEDEPVEVNGVLCVSNGYNSYDYDLHEVDNWIKYDLCKICEHDLRTYGCNSYKCLNT